MRIVVVGLLLGGLALAMGCATTPGGIAPSTTPLEGRKYTVLGPTQGVDSRICLLGILPISGRNSLKGAIEKAVRRKNADALIEVTADAYNQYWILFSKNATHVEGIAIRFTQ
jgi:hypothetical protein